MSEKLRERLYTLYSAYSRGNLDFAMNFFDQDARFFSYAPTTLFPCLGRQIGKLRIAETMKTIHLQYEFLIYQPLMLVVEGDTAAAIIMAKAKQRTTNRIIVILVAHFIFFEHDRIVELREFMDSFDLAEQVLGRELGISGAPGRLT